MLIVTRRPGESILINENISITVLGVNRKVVRLGVVAPKNVSIHREEVYEKIKKAHFIENEKEDN